MSDLFNLDDVLALEKKVMNHLDLKPSINYFKEEVAQYLYNAWLKDNGDTRIIEYCFPMIQSIIVKHINLLNGLPQEEVFNSLVVILLEHLPKYKPTFNDKKRRLFTYFTLILNFKIKDILTHNIKIKNTEYSLEEDMDNPLDTTEAQDTLLDFKMFITQLKDSQGPSSDVFLSALLTILDDSSKYHAQDRRMLLTHLVAMTKYPPELVTHMLNRTIERYQHSILD